MASLRPTGYDWYQLTLCEDGTAEDDPTFLDTAVAADYAAVLAGEPGVRVDVPASLAHQPLRADTLPQVERLRLHLTHLPLLGGHGGTVPHLVAPVAPHLLLPEEWREELRAYQVDAAAWMRQRCGSLLAHDLGLGKTRTALAAAKPPILVLCPKTAISVWQDECEYAGLRCTTLEGRPPKYKEVVAFFAEHKATTDVWLLNYHVAEHWVNYFCSAGPVGGVHTIIADEAHYLQKPQLVWTEALNGVEREKCLLLTATPIRNRLRSLWSLLNTACPRAFGTQTEFRKSFCGAVDGPYGLVDGQPSPEALSRLQLRLDEVLHKLTREEAGHAVPPLKRYAHAAPVSQADLNDALDASALATARLHGGAGTTVTWYTDMRRRFGLLKVHESARLVAEMLPKWKRCVVWVWHDDVVTELKKELRVLLPGDVFIDEILGKTSQKKRDAVARLWKAKKSDTVEGLAPRVLIVSIGAGSQAISLTTAGLAVFVELDWAPLQMQQAEKRTHRFGQIHPSCEVVYVVLRGTIDETISDVLLEKSMECEEVLGVDGQVDQMRSLFGGVSVVSAESDADFMQHVAARLLSARKAS